MNSGKLIALVLVAAAFAGGLFVGQGREAAPVITALTVAFVTPSRSVTRSTTGTTDPASSMAPLGGVIANSRFPSAAVFNELNAFTRPPVTEAPDSAATGTTM